MVKDNLLRLAKREGWQGEVRTLSCRSERVLIGAGDVVMKAHAHFTNSQDLRARLNIVSMEPWNQVFLKPLRQDVFDLGDDRVATAWPLARVLDENQNTIPWEHAAWVLAKLHSIPIDKKAFSFEPPKSRAVTRVKLALAQLRDVPEDDRDAVWRTIDDSQKTLDLSEGADQPTHWVHGDWHLGQIVDISFGSQPNLRLIDMEDMGIGNAAWDLARPAAFFAAGLLSAEDWHLFLDTYQNEGGRALPRGEDPWLTLDNPARSLVVQCAANAWIKAKEENRSFRDDEQLLIDACERICLTNLSL
ncbi:MAG: aminoglycoside phosphotransferase family protein [Proteobacteria bacterium]|nr:MAG: aminoglycoside phosphotransferase family protein [Pseudomonadota bacterium]